MTASASAAAAALLCTTSRSDLSSRKGTCDTHHLFRVCCLASEGSGYGPSPTDKGNNTREDKDALEQRNKSLSGSKKAQKAPAWRNNRNNKPNNIVFDEKFLQKVESVKRSAAERKKAEANKAYQAIDYDAPVEKNESTIGLGTKVGIGIAVVVFGLVFAFGDFLPYGSSGQSNNTAEVSAKLTEEERTALKRELEGYETTLVMSPEDPAALEGAAVTSAQLGEFEKASTILNKLIQVSSDKVNAYRLLGEVKYEAKDFEGSVSAYRRSLDLSEDADFDVLRGLTNALLAAKRPDEAVEILLSSRNKLRGENLSLENNLMNSNSKDAQKLETLDPIQLDLLIGKAYSDWGHVADAVAVYDELISEHPNDFRGYLAKGIILKENGKVGDAERMFIQAKFFAPDAAKPLVDRYAQR